jgi:hypothetical protein
LIKAPAEIVARESIACLRVIPFPFICTSFLAFLQKYTCLTSVVFVVVNSTLSSGGTVSE